MVKNSDAEPAHIFIWPSLSLYFGGSADPSPDIIMYSISIKYEELYMSLLWMYSIQVICILTPSDHVKMLN